MGAEKGGTKSGRFFHLFDWNRKSRKKLFSNGAVSPESSKHERRSDNNLPTARLRLDDEDETIGVSSVKDSSNCSCASSVADEGFASRPPGVVAMLMGLDSMPTSGASELISTPFFDSRFLREKLSNKRSPEFCINGQFNNITHRNEGYTRKPMELRSQKMPSSPIERFQTETIPSRSAKSLPLSHHKLLSPIKNPGFISSKNAAHIMEAAAKILDPGLQPGMRTKVSSFESSSVPLKVRESKESMMATQSLRTMRILESARMPAESTNVRYGQGQSLNRCWNGPEDNTLYRHSPDYGEASSADATSKGKSISLAIQAKVNVQRREGLSSSHRYTSTHKDPEERKPNQTFRSQPNNQKNKQQRKVATSNGSGVLRQNNQKQNCLSNKSKLPQKQLVTNQHSRKVLSGGDATSMKNITVSKLSGKSRVAPRKEGLQTTNLERRDELLSANEDFPCKKRLIERGFASEKIESANNVPSNRHHKHVQPNVVIDERTYPRWAEVSRSNGADVVSFTFTSPLIKPLPRIGSSIQVSDKWDKRNFCFDTNNQKNDSDAKDKKALSHGLNVITGDALSVLLEKKLKELQSGASRCNFVRSDSFSASSSITQELLPDFDTPSTSTAEHERKFVHIPYRDNHVGAFHPGISSTNGLVKGLNRLQQAEEGECSSSSSSDARKEPSPQHSSPLSTLESSFSSGSFMSTESSDSSNGSKVCSSSFQAKNITPNSVTKNISSEAEMELLDSASSTLSSDTLELSRRQIIATDEEMEYVKEISSLCSLACAETLHPLVFSKLEGEGDRQGKDGKMRRKLLFDCVNECLGLKRNKYFRAGYKSWANGMEVVGKNSAEELYEEISGWKSMGDRTVDELVGKEMSTHRGRWVDFEIEAFETGKEIEGEIVSSLLDEMISDYLICK